MLDLSDIIFKPVPWVILTEWSITTFSFIQTLFNRCFRIVLQSSFHVGTRTLCCYLQSKPIQCWLEENIASAKSVPYFNDKRVFYAIFLKINPVSRKMWSQSLRVSQMQISILIALIIKAHWSLNQMSVDTRSPWKHELHCKSFIPMLFGYCSSQKYCQRSSSMW